jgi:predicted enzyme related to lactoylglutathione lyase
MFAWRELLTDDDARARRFYGELLGWTWSGMDAGPDGTYWLALLGSQRVGGVMGRPAGVPGAPAWRSYVLVPDVDAAAARCQGAGGRVLYPPEDIPGVGRFAVLADPWGAVLQPFRAVGSESEPLPPGAGVFCWETLVTPDPAAAAAFYGKVFGFATAQTQNGEGTMFTAGQGGQAVADLQPAGAGGRPAWLTYVQGERAEATRDQAVRLGGKVLVPRIDVPQVGIVSMIADPSGAALGLFQPG